MPLPVFSAKPTCGQMRLVSPLSDFHCPLREVQRVMNAEVRMLSTSAVTVASARAAASAVIATAVADRAGGAAAE